MRNDSNRKQNGFSLIELLIVVAIILIIAAIAIPSYVKAKGAAQESAAIGALRAVNTGEQMYSNSYDSMYAGALAALGGTPGAAATCAGSQLLDNNTLTGITAGQFKGYTWTYSPTGATITGAGVCTGTNGSAGFVISAVPIQPAGNLRSLCTDENGTIHYDTADSAPVTESACELLPTL